MTSDLLEAMLRRSITGRLIQTLGGNSAVGNSRMIDANTITNERLVLTPASPIIARWSTILKFAWE